MEKMNLERGDVVQLNPNHPLGGFFLVVTEPKDWGCQGYLMHFANFDATRFKGKAYLRPLWEDIEFVGHSTWICIDKPDEEECQKEP